MTDNYYLVVRRAKQPKWITFLLVYPVLNLSLLFQNNQFVAQNSWAQKADYPGGNRWSAFGFAIGGKGYMGGGMTPGSPPNLYSDFWEYDPATGLWTQKADFAGGGKLYAVAFSIGNKGYVGLGADNSTVFKDFWEYNPSTDIWTKLGDFPGMARFMAVGFAINGKGYVSTGMEGDFSTHLQDLWEYDPASDTWIKKANFPGGARRAAVAFTVGSKAYVGTGVGAGYFKDFWEYDPAAGMWTQKSDFPGSPIRAWAAAFAICNNGYLTTGWDNTNVLTKDLWEYAPANNTWTQKTDFGGVGKIESVAFSIGAKGYLGVGGSSFIPDDDFWEYTPDTCTSIISSQNVLCNGQCTGTAIVTSVTGTPPFSYNWSNGQNTQSITGLCAGTYSVVINDSMNNAVTDTFTVFQPDPLSALFSITEGAGSCSANAFVAASGGTPGYSYSWNTIPVQTTSSVAGLCAGIYTCTITDSNGCSKTDSITVTMAYSENSFIPSSFTPNGDNTNDLFYIYGNELKNIDMKIFNRWGEIIFESPALSLSKGAGGEAGWDGTFNKKTVPEGVYIYSAKITPNEGESYLRQGKITLIR